MIGYRLYFFDSSNRIVERDEFVAETQRDAIARLQGAFLTRAQFPKVELWEQKRFVQRLERVASEVA